MRNNNDLKQLYEEVYHKVEDAYGRTIEKEGLYRISHKIDGKRESFMFENSQLMYEKDDIIEALFEGGNHRPLWEIYYSRGPTNEEMAFLREKGWTLLEKDHFPEYFYERYNNSENNANIVYCFEHPVVGRRRKAADGAAYGIATKKK